MQKIHTVREPRRFKSWLYAVARYTASNNLRGKLRDKLTGNDAELERVADDDDDPEAFANADLVHFGLGRLPVDQREILTLYFLEGFPLLEIGEILGLPEGTVKSRLHRAKAALKTILIREGGQR